MKKTNAVRLLTRHKIDFELLIYNYDAEDLSVEQIATSNDLPVGKIFKTLVAKGDRTGIIVAVIPGDQNLDLKALAKVSGNKKAALVPVRDIQALTGYIRGGCSPVGMKKDYPVFIARQAFEFDRIYINAGARGLLMLIDPEELGDVCRATPADITG